MKPIKVCFISLRSYSLFNQRSEAYFGGAEVQVSLLAKELAKDKHFQVSLITGDYGQPPVINQDKLTLYKTRLFDFLKILKTIDADIYVERTVNPKVRLVGWWCRLFKKKFVYMIAHNWDTRYSGLKLADLIIAQHSQQNLALKKNLNLNSLIMLPMVNLETNNKSAKRKFILWVGRADNWKKPLDFIDLARRFQKEKFVMICRSGKNKILFNRVKTEASFLTNLKFLPAVAPEKIVGFFNQAKVLINTSIAEGFPNTFLQAGATKTPVLSYWVNPDNYLKQFHCGLVGRRQFQSIFNQPAKLTIMGQNHFNYVKQYHSLKNLELFKQTLYKL